MKSNLYHESVMVEEVIENLHIKTGSLYIDATSGSGGHALEIIKAGGRLLGIEVDPEMLAIAKKRVPKGIFVLGNFTDIDEIAKANDFDKVSGIIFDLGLTNIQLTSDSRGFSFGNPEADLDMRVNPKGQGLKGSDLLNALREDQLTDMFGETLDRGAAGWLARRVIKARPIMSVGDFLRVSKGLRVKASLNEATLPFLALRIAVNSELDNLKEVLPKAYGLLQEGGKLIVISFHSGEDRIIKEFGGGKAILPSNEEVGKNPKARSAKLRVITK